MNYLHAKFQINILRNKKVIKLLELWTLWLKRKKKKQRIQQVVITTLKRRKQRIQKSCYHNSKKGYQMCFLYQKLADKDIQINILQTQLRQLTEARERENVVHLMRERHREQERNTEQWKQKYNGRPVSPNLSIYHTKILPCSQTSLSRQRHQKKASRHTNRHTYIN